MGGDPKSCDAISTEEPSLLQQILHDGSVTPAHEGHPVDTPPPWLDMDKFTRGQQFSQKYLVPVLVGNFFAMMFIWVWQPIFRVILYTRNLETIRKAAKRNFITMVYLKSWYESDLWDPTTSGHQNMKKVHRLHTVAATESNQKPEEMETVAANMGSEAHVENQCNLYKVIRKVMASEGAYQPPLQFQVPNSLCYVSQMDSAVTVLGIIAPILLSPEKIGIHGATKQDLEGFAHMWRVLSYHLGIQDRYNPCSGNLYMVQTRCQEVVDGMVYASLANMTKEQEYIMRMNVEGTLKTTRATKVFSFDDMFLYLMWVLNDYQVSEFYRMCSWDAKLRFWIFQFVILYVVRIPFVLWGLNYAMQKVTTKPSSRKGKKYL